MSAEIDYIEDNLAQDPDAEVDSLLKSIRDMGDMYFVSQLLLAKLEQSKSNNRVIAELAYLLDNKSFMNLLLYFEGETIRIPTRAELKEVLQMMMIYYNYQILKKPWKQALQDLGIPYDYREYRKLWTRYWRFIRSLAPVKLPKDLKSEEDNNESVLS